MNITTIKKKNEENGFTFFDSKRLKLTKGKVHPEVYSLSDRHLFILECDDLFRRTFEVIYFDSSTGFCGRLEGTIGYSSLADARKYALKLTKDSKPKKKNVSSGAKRKSLKSKQKKPKTTEVKKKKTSLKTKRRK